MFLKPGLPAVFYSLTNKNADILNSTPYCRLLCACAWSWSIVWWFWVLYLLTIIITSTSYQEISKPRPCIVEAKAKAKTRSLRGQGQGRKILSSSCPRGRGQSSRTPSLLKATHKSMLRIQYTSLSHDWCASNSC